MKSDYVFYLHSTGNRIALKDAIAYETYLSRFDYFQLTLSARITKKWNLKTTLWK